MRKAISFNLGSLCGYLEETVKGVLYKFSYIDGYSGQPVKHHYQHRIPVVILKVEGLPALGKEIVNLPYFPVFLYVRILFRKDVFNILKFAAHRFVKRRPRYLFFCRTPLWITNVHFPLCFFNYETLKENQSDSDALSRLCHPGTVYRLKLQLCGNYRRSLQGSRTLF